jgi:SNF2-related domain
MGGGGRSSTSVRGGHRSVSAKRLLLRRGSKGGACAVQTVPEIGQLAIVRKRPFVITEIIPSAPGLVDEVTKASHLIKLSSVEDDGLGEELQVIWELEPGTTVHEKSTLPDPVSFDHPKRLQAFLDAVRWGAVSQADDKALQSPFRSGIEVDEYQLDPVVRALSMPRVNLLIADDVGLGKTIEAGLVVQEMILRHRVRTVLIVCPSSLQLQWQEEMRDKFGLDFRIIDSEAISNLRRKRGIHVNPWSHFPRLITSIDFLKRERPLRTFRETLPAGDQPTYPRAYGHGQRHVVHGHDQHADGPILKRNRTNLDTFAWSSGRLVIGVFDDDTPGGPLETLEARGPPIEAIRSA